APGDYWVMAVYEATAGHTDVDRTATGNVYYYQSLPFGDPIPATGAGFSSVMDADFPYFLDITCTTLEVQDLVFENKLTLYPNPVSNFININGLIAPQNFLIFNILGKSVLKGVVQPKEQINIQNLKQGLYFIQFENSTSLKFIKK
ncbi:T9SS type A sorting domain-containing protein, partial [Flavivirga jejuensis]